MQTPFPAAALAAALLAAAPVSGAEPILRASAPPSAAERESMASWQSSWEEEAAPVVRAFRSLRSAAAGETPISLRPYCLALAEGLLDLDRRRVLPAPHPATDFHLRRGLRQLDQAAFACLTKRPYATHQALAWAARAFREVDRSLVAYGIELAPSLHGSSGRGGRKEPTRP